MLTAGSANGTWNGENRLIEIYDDTTGKKVEFVYDYMGRRVEKKVYTGTSGTSWTLNTHEKFVYDGYKCIEVLDGANSNAILQKFLWSGDELLSVYDVAATATYYYFADGNKNIGQLMDSSGNIVAKYEYSPFGVQTSASGTYVATNPFRFSSEYYDSETGLAYYNYRYYSPTLGRWLSRDPIAEAGGSNLYAMVSNNPIGSWDKLGLCDCDDDESLDDFLDFWFSEYGDPLFGADDFLDNQPEWFAENIKIVVLVPGSEHDDAEEVHREYWAEMASQNSKIQVIEVDDIPDAIAKLNKYFKDNGAIKNLIISGHGDEGRIAVGSKENFKALNPDSLILSSSNVNSFIKLINLAKGANVTLFGCHTGDTNKAGFNLAETISKLTGGATRGVHGDVKCEYSENGGYQLYTPYGTVTYRGK
jgi:RHS repeat-associated protein